MPTLLTASPSWFYGSKFIYLFSGPLLRLIFMCKGDWGLLIWIGILYTCNEKFWQDFSLPYYGWLITTDLSQNSFDRNLMASDCLKMLVPETLGCHQKLRRPPCTVLSFGLSWFLTEIMLEQCIWALQSSTVDLKSVEVFLLDSSSLWCFKELFLAKNLPSSKKNINLLISHLVIMEMVVKMLSWLYLSL